VTGARIAHAEVGAIPIEGWARAGREGYVGSGRNTCPGEATKWKSFSSSLRRCPMVSGDWMIAL
jgi:hypothetical protein